MGGGALHVLVPHFQFHESLLHLLHLLIRALLFLHQHLHTLTDLLQCITELLKSWGNFRRDSTTRCRIGISAAGIRRRGTTARWWLGWHGFRWCAASRGHRPARRRTTGTRRRGWRRTSRITRRRRTTARCLKCTFQLFQ